MSNLTLQVPSSHSQAKGLLADSRHGFTRLGHNTYLLPGSDGDINITYHASPIFTYHPNGSYTFSLHGYNTRTTRHRLNLIFERLTRAGNRISLTTTNGVPYLDFVYDLDTPRVHRLHLSAYAEYYLDFDWDTQALSVDVTSRYGSHRNADAGHDHYFFETV